MKKLCLVLVMLFALVLVAACSKEEKVGLERIEDNGKLVVGFTDFQPFGYQNEKGDYVGFDLELAKMVADELGVEVEYKYINWKAQVAELNENVDCIWNAMTITETRKENMVFTKPYWETNLVAVVKADSELTTVEDIKGKNIAVEANSTADISLNESKDYQVTQYTKVSDARLAVSSGQADALVADATYVDDILTKYSGEYKKLEGTIGEVEEYGVAFRKNEADIKDKVDQIIDKLYTEGKITPLLEKYFGEGNGFKR